MWRRQRISDVELAFSSNSMIIYRLLMMIILLVWRTITSEEDLHVSRDYLNVNVGKRVRMECELNGNKRGLWLRLEDAEVFFYSTSRISSDQRFQIEQRTSLRMINGTLADELRTYSLIIDDIHLSDGGTYSCQSDNKIIKLFLLNIVERPYFITHEYSTTIRTQVGRNLSMNCEAHSKPTPNLSWIKKIDDHNQKLMINCSIVSPMCQLNLPNVTRWHHGIYECVAMNIVGTIGRFYELDVQFPPDVYTRSEKSYHSFGETVILHCFIDGNPEPDIQWFHRIEGSREKDISRQFPSENFDEQGNQIWYIQNEQLNNTRWKTSLFIKHLSRRFFNSNFICRAKNRFGFDEKSITIIEKSFSSRRYYYQTTSSTSSPPVPERRFPTSTEFLPDELPNRSRRISSSFLLIIYLYLINREYLYMFD